MRESGFIGGVDEDATVAAPPAEALLEVLGRAEKALAVLDAEDVHRHDLVTALRDTTLQVVIVLRSGFARGLEAAFGMAEALSESDGSGIRVLAAPWGDSRFPSVALVDGGQADGAYHLVIGRSGSADSPLSFTGRVDVHQDTASTVDEWFMRVWDLSTELDRVRELEQPVFGRADPEVVADLAAQWDRFVEGVRAEHEPAATQEGGPANLDGADDPSLGLEAAEDPSAPWALFPIDTPGASDEEQQDLSDAPVAVDRRTSILAVRPSSPLERDLREIYARGVLVSVHTSQKVPTFRFDVNAALGISERATWGPATVQSPIRLKLLPDDVTREVNAAKIRARLLSGSHSFALDKYQHWMPRATVPHFARALADMGKRQEPIQLLEEGAEKFVAGRMAEYMDSLQRTSTAQAMNISWTDERVERLRQAIVAYLKKHQSVKTEASFSVEGLGYEGATADDYTRPFNLLLSVARKTRQRVRDGDSPNRKVAVPPVETWDVVGGDKVLSVCGTSAHVAARRQLLQIEQIADAGPSEETCTALITLMRSDPELTFA